MTNVFATKHPNRSGGASENTGNHKVDHSSPDLGMGMGKVPDRKNTLKMDPLPPPVGGTLVDNPSVVAVVAYFPVADSLLVVEMGGHKDEEKTKKTTETARNEQW